MRKIVNNWNIFIYLNYLMIYLSFCLYISTVLGVLRPTKKYLIYTFSGSMIVAGNHIDPGEPSAGCCQIFSRMA